MLIYTAIKNKNPQVILSIADFITISKTILLYSNTFRQYRN